MANVIPWMVVGTVHMARAMTVRCFVLNITVAVLLLLPNPKHSRSLRLSDLFVEFRFVVINGGRKIGSGCLNLVMLDLAYLPMSEVSMLMFSRCLATFVFLK